MSIEDLCQVRNKNVAQQNELTYLEMKQCMESLTDHSWIASVLEKQEESVNEGILISLSDVPDQGGMLWYGTWLSKSQRFYEFEAPTSEDSAALIHIEYWQEVNPDIAAHNIKRG